MDEMLDGKKAESINPYLLGAGIFALTLGLLSKTVSYSYEVR